MRLRGPCCDCSRPDCKRGPIPTMVTCGRWCPLGCLAVDKDEMDLDWNILKPMRPVMVTHPWANTPTRILVLRLIERDGNRCHWCGREVNLGAKQNNDLYPTLDHYPVPRSQGGKTKLDNLVLACRQCNNGRQSKRFTGQGMMPRSLYDEMVGGNRG